MEDAVSTICDGAHDAAGDDRASPGRRAAYLLMLDRSVGLARQARPRSELP